MRCGPHSQKLRSVETLQSPGCDTHQGKLLQPFQPLQARKRLFMSHQWHLQAFGRFGHAWRDVHAMAGITVVALKAARGTRTLWAMQQFNVLGRYALEPCFCFENESIGKKKMPVLLFSGASLTSILLWITGSKIWPNLNYCYWERLEKYKYWAGEWAQWIREKNAIQTKRREKLLCGDGKRTGEGKRKLKLNGKMQYIGHPFKPVYILVVRSVP